MDWKPIDNLKAKPGRYRVSRCGVVQVYYPGIAAWKPMKVKPQVKTGYLKVGLIDGDGKQWHHLVHRLVAEAWLEKPEGKDVVAHLDGSRDNNHADNLVWCTAKENCAHKVDHGTQLRGEQLYNASLSDEQALAIWMEARRGVTPKELAARYAVSLPVVHNVVGGRSYRHVTSKGAVPAPRRSDRLDRRRRLGGLKSTYLSSELPKTSRLNQ